MAFTQIKKMFLLKVLRPETRLMQLRSRSSNGAFTTARCKSDFALPVQQHHEASTDAAARVIYSQYNFRPLSKSDTTLNLDLINKFPPLKKAGRVLPDPGKLAIENAAKIHQLLGEKEVQELGRTLKGSNFKLDLNLMDMPKVKKNSVPKRQRSSASISSMQNVVRRNELSEFKRTLPAEQPQCSKQTTVKTTASKTCQKFEGSSMPGQCLPSTRCSSRAKLNAAANKTRKQQPVMRNPVPKLKEKYMLVAPPAEKDAAANDNIDMKKKSKPTAVVATKHAATAEPKPDANKPKSYVSKRKSVTWESIEPADLQQNQREENMQRIAASKKQQQILNAKQLNEKPTAAKQLNEKPTAAKQHKEKPTAAAPLTAAKRTAKMPTDVKKPAVKDSAKNVARKFKPMITPPIARPVGKLVAKPAIKSATRKNGAEHRGRPLLEDDAHELRLVKN